MSVIVIPFNGHLTHSSYFNRCYEAIILDDSYASTYSTLSNWVAYIIKRECKNAENLRNPTNKFSILLSIYRHVLPCMIRNCTQNLNRAKTNLIGKNHPPCYF